MLIDRRHSRWIWATLIIGIVALLLYLSVYNSTPGGLRGGSLVGMWYGIIGSGLMVYAELSALRKVPSWWWIGSRKVWLKGHIWLGLLSGLFLLCHSGFRWGGPLEVLLWAVVIGTLATGVLGLGLQQIVPRLLTAHFPTEVPYEQIPHLCDVLRHKADELMVKVRASSTVDAVALEKIGQFFDEEVRPFLQPCYRRRALLASPLRADTGFGHLQEMIEDAAVREQLSQLKTYCQERRQWGEQERYQLLLHGWLLFHVPLSVLVLVLGLVHAFTALYY